MADTRRVYVCHKCTHSETCVAVSETEPGDEMVRCPCDYETCEWTELDPLLARAVLMVLADEQGGRQPRGRC